MASHVDKHAPAIELEALTKYYGSTRGIDELDLTVDRGEVMGFIGPNGAGKTTAIRVMLDFIRPTSGSARVLGLDSRAHALELRRRVGYLPAELAFFDALTTTEYVRWLERMRECPPDRAFELAERLGLDTSRRIGELSSGNRRKVGLVQALLHRPELVILDEPTAGLDPIVQREFRRLVAEARDEGTTVFMSSHILSQVEAVCDRVAMIVDGRLRDVRSVPRTAETRRRIRVEFDGDVDTAELLRIPGVVDVRHELAAIGATVTIDVSGAIDQVIKWIARHDIRDLTSEAAGLDDLFLIELDAARDDEATSATDSRKAARR